MTNQLTELFDMTDASDVPDEAIEAVIKELGCNWETASVRRDAAFIFSDRLIIAFARHIAREHPEWIEDPDLAEARRIAAEHGASGDSFVSPILAAFKAGRAAERAGQ